MSISPNAAGFVLNSSQLSTWRSEFFNLPLNRLALNVCTLGDPIIASQRANLQGLAVAGKEHYAVTKLKKSTVGGPIWICTGLDLLRQSLRKDYELSAPYLFYWHKLERCNYFLNTVIKCLARHEPVDGRTFRYLMKHTVPDGGNWQMFVNLVKKYGVMPKDSYLASWSSTRTLHLNRMLRSKLHEFSSQLHAQFILTGNPHKLALMVEPMVEELYKIISICLGTPPTSFTFHLKDENQDVQLTPLSFYERMIAPYFALDAQVSLGHDPRPSSSYERNYCVAHSSNMMSGLEQSYNNQPMDVLLEVMTNSLAAGSPVWLACDVQLICKNKVGVLSLKAHNFEQVFGMPVGTDLDKADRMLYKATRRNTALLVTEVSLDALRQPLQFGTMRRTSENDATKKTESRDSITEYVDTVNAAKGDAAKADAAKRKMAIGKATVLHVDWLREYAFEIVVDARFVPPAVMNALRTQPSEELPIWDPMGALLS
ncbi:bleomycin hydrolase [Drosophila hydei]|uniref:Bleomycin hydrolase n=1 Tax=Drosophila hydei TaxID=7224 RepID=A0A6J1LK53_DROHY|nr:bleomycin hydrolase [Drosophila hydei]